MKILMLTDQLALGGAETHIATLANGLREQGHTVELASAGGPYAAMLAREGFQHHLLPWGGKHIPSLLAARKRLSLLLKAGGYDIVHAHARMPAFLADPLCRKWHIPLVTTAHWVFRADGWRGRLSRWGDHTLAVSRDICHYLQANYHLPRTRITCTQNGIDTAVFYPEKATEEARGRLIHVSRLDEGRAEAAAALIRLAPRLAEAGCSRLTIVGEGDRFSRLKQEADAINHQLQRDLICMTGGQAEIAPLLRANDIFIGVSRAALEAMACGLPTLLAGDEGYLSLVTPARAAQAEESNFCCRGAAPLCDEDLFYDLAALLADRQRQRLVGQWGVKYMADHHAASSMVSDALHAYRAAKQSTLPPVIICGYYGFENVGDETVLAALLRRLRRAGYRRTVVLSARPRETKSRHRTAAVGRLAICTVWRVGRAGGIFLLGGGNLLQNETSKRSLFYYTRMMQLAKRSGCRVYLFGGIGKLDAQGAATACRALWAVDACFGRTPRDVAKLQKMCKPQQPVFLLPDHALWTRPAAKIAGTLPSAPFILLALRGMAASSQRQAAIMDACAALAKQEGLGLVFACLHPTQDRETARLGVARCPYAQVLPPLPAEELVALLQRHARLVVATRLHALLFAAVAGVPAVTLADGSKISDMAAFAATCDTEGAPLLTCLPNTNGLRNELKAALHATHGKEQSRHYLHALRTAGAELLPKDGDGSFLWQNETLEE